MFQRVTIAAVLLLSLGVSVSVRADEKGTKIGVVSIQRVLSDCQEAKDINVRMEAAKKDYDQTTAQKQKALADLRASLQTDLKPGTPQYEERRKEFVKQVVEAKSWQELQQEDLQRQQKQNMRSLYEKIEQAVSELAAKKGLDLVLPDSRQPFPDSVDGVNIDQLRDFIRSRTVLYAHPSIDISSEVVAQLDARYKEKK
jgi:outer membrane protein